MKSKTPKVDLIEQICRQLEQPGGPAYGDMMALARRLEKECSILQIKITNLEDALKYCMNQSDATKQLVGEDESTIFSWIHERAKKALNA